MDLMRYCPRCGSALGMKLEGGRERPACLADGCGFVYFGESSIGCGAVVLRDDRALLVQRGIEPGKGSWQIPGGYVETDEGIPAAVEREVLEEAGVVARVIEVVGFRHAAGVQPDRPSSNIYVVFRLDFVSGEPRFDGEETLGVGYFSLEEMAQMDRVQALSLWAIRLAMDIRPGSGFVPDGADELARPGWSLFGLPRRNPEGL
jgi:ADP-ribose pyrophosphatase YjhB (NUDIX family)